MASLKDIRSRIQSTKNTQQITRAMKMVSAAKLRRAQQNVVNTRPYAGRLRSMIQRISASHRVTHPWLGYLDQAQRVLVIVVSSDRGLCGGFNNNANRFAYDYYLEHKDKMSLEFLFIGRKSADYFKRRGVMGKETIQGMDKQISYEYAGNLVNRVLADFSDGHYDEVRVIYNEFKSALQQVPVCEKLLPAHLEISEGAREEDNHDILFEPEPEAVIDQLLRKHFAIQMYRCLCESLASEHGARMTAMENATKNAQEVIRLLTLTYNKLRQANITTELTEITSGAEALKG